MAGGTDFCEPDALLAFTDRAESIADSVDALVSRLDAARVDRGAFGRMPFIGDDVYAAYDEHVDGTRSGIKDAQAAISGAGLGTARCAAEWLQAETGTIEQMTEVGG